VAVRVAVEGPDLVVRMSGWDVVWGFAREVRVALRDVESVAVVPRRAVLRRFLLRLWGTAFVGVVAGWYGWFGRGLHYYCFHRADRLLSVSVRPAGRRLRGIVVQVADPDADAARIDAVRGAA
jgi:hypothetical protein